MPTHEFPDGNEYEIKPELEDTEFDPDDLEDPEAIEALDACGFIRRVNDPEAGVNKSLEIDVAEPEPSNSVIAKFDPANYDRFEGMSGAEEIRKLSRPSSVGETKGFTSLAEGSDTSETYKSTDPLDAWYADDGTPKRTIEKGSVRDPHNLTKYED